MFSMSCKNNGTSVTINNIVDMAHLRLILFIRSVSSLTKLYWHRHCTSDNVVRLSDNVGCVEASMWPFGKCLLESGNVRLYQAVYLRLVVVRHVVETLQYAVTRSELVPHSSHLTFVRTMIRYSKLAHQPRYCSSL